MKFKLIVLVAFMGSIVVASETQYKNNGSNQNAASNARAIIKEQIKHPNRDQSYNQQTEKKKEQREKHFKNTDPRNKKN